MAAFVGVDASKPGGRGHTVLCTLSVQGGQPRFGYRTATKTPAELGATLAGLLDQKQASYIVLSPDRIGTEIYAALCAATARWPRSEVYEPHKAPVGPAPELNQLEQDQGALYSVLLREAIQQDPEVLTALQDHRATRNADGHPIWAPMEGDVGGRLAASILALAALRIYRENHAADQLWIGPHERLVAISQVERLYGWEQQDLAFLNLHWLAARLERVEAPEGGRAKAGHGRYRIGRLWQGFGKWPILPRRRRDRAFIAQSENNKWVLDPRGAVRGNSRYCPFQALVYRRQYLPLEDMQELCARAWVSFEGNARTLANTIAIADGGGFIGSLPPANNAPLMLATTIMAVLNRSGGLLNTLRRAG